MSEDNLSENGPSREPSKPTVRERSRSNSRRVRLGDTSPRMTPKGIESFVINESITAAQESQVAAVRDIIASAPVHDIPAVANSLKAILAGASAEDAALLRGILANEAAENGTLVDTHPDEEL